MTTYTVDSVISSEQKPKKAGGTFTKYLLELQDGQRAEFADFGEINPQRGTTFSGYEIRDEGFGPELKKVGSQPRGNGAKPSGRSQTHPEDARRMSRCHAQEMALRYTAIQVQRGKVEEFTIDSLKKVIDWFEADVG